MLRLPVLRGELLAVFDADPPTPPELLGRFYDAYGRGHADLVNGGRRLYLMESEAMRGLNRLGNVFFAKGRLFVLGNRLSDWLGGTTLCGRPPREASLMNAAAPRRGVTGPEPRAEASQSRPGTVTCRPARDARARWFRACGPRERA